MNKKGGRDFSSTVFFIKPLLFLISKCKKFHHNKGCRATDKGSKYRCPELLQLHGVNGNKCYKEIYNKVRNIRNPELCITGF